MAGIPRNVPDGASRLAVARAALALAEQRAGLHDSAARDVQHAMTRALDAASGTGSGARAGGGGGSASSAVSPGSPPSQGATALDPALVPTLATDSLTAAGEAAAGTEPWLGLGPDSAGALAVTGSRTVLLAAAARRQGRHGWCAVVGGEDLGWSAAAEAGLDLARVLVVPAAGLAPSVLLAATSALLDGVDVLLVDAVAASCLRPRDRRTLLARARERGALILSDLPWEGARNLVAVPEGVDAGAEIGTDTGTGAVRGATAGDAGETGRGPARGGLCLVTGLGKAPAGPWENTSPAGAQVASHAPGLAAREMPAGYLRGLRWSLRDPSRPGAASRLELAPSGVSVRVPEAPALPERAALGVAVGAAPAGDEPAVVVPLTRRRR